MGLWYDPAQLNSGVVTQREDNMTTDDCLVLFDFNGVIADDEPVHQMMLQKVMAEEGIQISDADYQDIYLGFDDRGCFTEAYRRQERVLDADGLADLTRRKSAYYDAYIAENLVLFPNVVACVQALAAQFPLGIVSGALGQEIENICKQAGIWELFGLVIPAEDTEACKPHPEGYLKALALYNLALASHGRYMAPEQCVVIEDSVAGVAAAVAAGMRCIAVTHSYPASALSQADLIVEQVAQITPQTIASLLDSSA